MRLRLRQSRARDTSARLHALEGAHAHAKTQKNGERYNGRPTLSVHFASWRDLFLAIQIGEIMFLSTLPPKD
jgi:hypothetical protein